MNMDKQALISAFQDMEDFAILKKIDCPPIYLLGGSACIVEGYLDRVTRDIDIIDLHYSANVGRLFRILGEVDYLDIYLTTLAEGYSQRAIRVREIKHIEVYALSVEDIIVTKIGRYSGKDKEDIKELLKKANKETINVLIEDVKKRENISHILKAYFLENVKKFRRDFCV
ncbi:hypothetical protein EDC19_0941 [Natranaerovirga hydrolytica]|uniref:DUF6036 domain-containing protein n=1 Tax=Natranaerovirga hydrolytica TaxID=680378 RepID=A0A4R1N669_9FIRM|nr:DUF6036 family nucleotidyltransferase [Natranaerovirga hydrolytica]TCK98519.1 hypothetical protein EDC19_0941 [Natranaerovirga hydrolytica]